MFRGLNAVSLDSKGRLAIPARARAVLAGFASVVSSAADVDVAPVDPPVSAPDASVPSPHSQAAPCVVATIDPQEPCILLYPLPEWERVEAKLQALPTLHKATRRMQRLLIGHATVQPLDGQGRILLSPFLRAYADLAKKTVLVGQGKRMELWSEPVWSRERDRWLEESNADEGGAVPDALNVLCL